MMHKIIDRIKVKELYDKGFTGKKIAKIIGCDIHTIYNIVKKEFGLSLRKRINRAKIKELFNNGLNTKEIAKILNCNRSTIRYIGRIELNLSFKKKFDRVKIKELLDKGWKDKEIAKEINAMTSTISIIRRKEFSIKKKNKYPKKLKERIIQEVSNGKSFNEISRKFKIPLYTVQNWCRHANVKSFFPPPYRKSNEEKILNKLKNEDFVELRCDTGIIIDLWKDKCEIIFGDSNKGLHIVNRISQLLKINAEYKFDLFHKYLFYQLSPYQFHKLIRLIKKEFKEFLFEERQANKPYIAVMDGLTLDMMKKLESG